MKLLIKRISCVLGTCLFFYSGNSLRAEGAPSEMLRLNKPKVSPRVSVNENPRNIAGFMTAQKSKIAKEDTDIQFEADQIENNENNQTVTASGNVVIARETLTLKADRIIYNQEKDIITAEGNVILLEKNGDVIFTDRIELANKMSKGEMENIKILMRDKSRVYAETAKLLENNNKIMLNTVYSPCDVCCKKEDPLWQIRAAEVIHDNAKKDIDYKHVFIDIKGTPVFYTPYLSHPDPTVKRRSGLLFPVIGSSSYLGLAIQPKYFLDISDQEDITFSPILSYSKGIIPAASYRKYFYSGEITAEGTIMSDGERDANRGNLFSKGRYEINDNWVSSFDANYTSDRTYLRDMSLAKKDDAWLTSVAKAERFANRDYASLETYYYKLISYDIQTTDKPYVLPLMSYENVSQPLVYDSYVKTLLDFASVYRKEDQESHRMTMINSWVLPYTSSLGEKYLFQASVKSDTYYVDNYVADFSKPNDEFTGTTGRVLPQAGMEWKLPFVKAGENFRQILEPTIVAVAAPKSGQKEDRVPNEDSLYQELDDTNILSFDRYTGFDRNDIGSRVSYGLNWSAYGKKTGRVSAFIAQTYNIDNDEAFPNNSLSRSDNGFSDYVGRIYAAPNQYLDLIYRFRLDKENSEFKYNELATRFGPKILNAYIAYIYTQKDANSILQGYDERKEIFTALNAQLTKDWSLSIYNRQDMTVGGGSLEHGGALTYEDECLKFITNLRRDNSNDPSYKGGFEVSVSFMLKTLGSIGSK